MKILITAGGTSEPIDQVRSITNHATGRLGKEIAEVLTSKSWQVDYITTKRALWPAESESLKLHFIESAQDLLVKMTELLEAASYDAVIHSMAVSDFTAETAFSEEAFLAELAGRLPLQDTDDIRKVFEHLREASKNESKISSDTSRLFLALKKTPKVIQQIKKIQPDTLLFGFKLLADVPKEELLLVAKDAMKKNRADYVFANDLTEVENEKHHGYLISDTGEITEAFTKKEIAELIGKTVEERKRQLK